MKQMRGILWAGVLVLAVSGCDNEPAKGKVKAGVAAPQDTAGAAAPTETAARYPFSEADSKIEFVGAKVTGKHDGSFGKFSGLITGSAPEKGNVSVDIDMSSLVADAPKLTGHLKSADFFDVERFPKARFVSTAVRPGAEGGATHTITGNLTLHGVTRSITFPAIVRMTPESTAVDAEFAINRKDFGVTYPGMPDDLIKDDVLLKLTVRSRRQNA